MAGYTSHSPLRPQDQRYRGDGGQLGIQPKRNCYNGSKETGGLWGEERQRWEMVLLPPVIPDFLEDQQGGVARS